MIEYVLGDLLKAPERLIAHGCNNKGVMGSGPQETGIGGAIKKRWPEAFRIYQYACVSGGTAVGHVSFAEVASDKIVANVISQHGYGTDQRVRYCSYDGIDRGLRTVAEKARELELDTVGMCAIGSGLANGDWRVIREIVRGVSTSTGVNFRIYSLDEEQLKTLSS